MRDFLLFFLDERRFAVPVAAVRRVVPMVEVTPWPGALAGIAGVVTVHGEIVPVLDLRARHGLPSRPPRLSDHLLLATAGGRQVAVPVDVAEGVAALAEERKPAAAEKLLPRAGCVAGVVEMDGEPVFICDLERMAEESVTNKALPKSPQRKPEGSEKTL